MDFFIDLCYNQTCNIYEKHTDCGDKIKMTANNKKQFILFILKERLKPGIIFILLFSAYIIANIKNLAEFETEIYDIDTNVYINILNFLTVFGVIFASILLVYLFFWKINNIHRYILFFSSVVFAVELVKNKNLNMSYNLTVLAILFFIINYCLSNQDKDAREETARFFKYENIKLYNIKINFDFNVLMFFVSILVLVYIFIISQSGILRYKSFWSSTYDFGIFAQMFENMAKTGLQTTSVERNMILSHFSVHFSPFYYILLPVYMIFRNPECLIVIQVACVALGAFPLALIAKKFNLSNTNIFLIVVTYFLYPALSGGLFFDFHENKFLTVLIFWLLYFIISEKRSKYIFVYIFTVLILTIKEDSFIYVFFIALYMITLKKDNKFNRANMANGIIIAALSIIYFMLATHYLNTYGLGVMTYRFGIFLGWNEDGFLAIIANVLKNPALLFASLLSVPGKLEFVFYMFIPLCFLPFISKKFNFLLLIAPMIIINLATDYIYQYDINFQYTYGVIALLFFLAVKNLSEINIRHVKKICVMMVCFALVLSASKNYNRIHTYNSVYYAYKEDFIETEKLLEQIPMDASVSASTFLIPHLIKRENVYMIELFAYDYFDYDTDYIVNDLRGVDQERYKNFLVDIKRRGYKKIDSGMIIEIFMKEE